MESSQHDSVTRDFIQGRGEMLNGKEYLEDNDPETMLSQIKTSGTGSVTISADLFEKMYLQPKLEALPYKHPLQKIFGNPTALGILAFEMSLMPITMELMEWRVSGAVLTNQNSILVFYGGVLLWIAGMLEFILGNTFPFLVFMAFGSFYCSLGAQTMPDFNTYSAFATNATDSSTGLSSPAYTASYGHYWTAFTILMFFFFICTFRTNVVFVLLFLCIVPGTGCLAGVYYNIALGNVDTAHNCQLASGSVLFVACIVGWYLFAGLVFPTVDFPIPIPLGDLSRVVPGLSDAMSTAGGGLNPTRRLGLFRKKPAVVVDDAV